MRTKRIIVITAIFTHNTVVGGMPILNKKYVIGMSAKKIIAVASWKFLMLSEDSTVKLNGMLIALIIPFIINRIANAFDKSGTSFNHRSSIQSILNAIGRATTNKIQ